MNEHAEITWDQTPEDIRPTLRLYCDTLARRVAEGEGMVLAGRAGAGKTCCLRLICETASEVRVPWALLRAPVLFNLLHRERWGDYQESEAALLLIDDLGTEYPSDLATSRFVDLMLDRHERRQPVIIATNLSEADLAARPGMERVVSRLRERGPYLWTRREDQRRPVSVRDWAEEWERERVEAPA
ncbi:MAG: hypothetical protein ACE149_19770 [Armatimonadota bacterium]